LKLIIFSGNLKEDALCDVNRAIAHSFQLNRKENGSHPMAQIAGRRSLGGENAQCFVLNFLLKRIDIVSAP
jgi:hypothetical protein